MDEFRRFMPFSKEAFDLLRELIVYAPNDKAVCFAKMLSGGYIVFKRALADVDCIYSYGVDANNVIFDLSITKKLKLPCHCYKSTLGDVYKDSKYLTFHKSKGSSLGTFAGHVIENGHQDKNIFLKIDMEEGGWEFLETFKEPDFKRIPQIVVEHHKFLFPGEWPRYTEILRRINKYYYLCYVQALNTDFVGFLFDGKIYLHTKYAATYIRKDLGECVLNTKTRFPTKVEYPNITKRPYIPLDAWPYRSDRKSMYDLMAIVRLGRLRSFFNGMRDDVQMKKWSVDRVGDKLKVSSKEMVIYGIDASEKKIKAARKKQDKLMTIARKIKDVKD